MWRSVVLYLPTVLVSLLILTVGYVLARLARTVTTKALRRAGFDRLVHSGPAGRLLRPGTPSVTDVCARLVFAVVLLFTLQAAFGIWGPNPASDLITALISWLPQVLVAIVIVVVTTAIARAAHDLLLAALGGLAYGRVLAKVAAAVIVTLGVIAGLDQIGIATSVTRPLLITILATVAGVIIVGVGGGLIRPMQQRWEGWLDRAATEASAIRSQARAYAEQRSRQPADSRSADSRSADDRSADAAGTAPADPGSPVSVPADSGVSGTDHGASGPVRPEVGPRRPSPSGSDSSLSGNFGSVSSGPASSRAGAAFTSGAGSASTSGAGSVSTPDVGSASAAEFGPTFGAGGGSTSVPGGGSASSRGVVTPGTGAISAGSGSVDSGPADTGSGATGEDPSVAGAGGEPAPGGHDLSGSKPAGAARLAAERRGAGEARRAGEADLAAEMSRASAERRVETSGTAAVVTGGMVGDDDSPGGVSSAGPGVENLPAESESPVGSVVSSPGADVVPGPGADVASSPGADAVPGPGQDVASGLGADVGSVPGSAVPEEADDWEWETRWAEEERRARETDSDETQVIVAPRDDRPHMIPGFDRYDDPPGDSDHFDEEDTVYVRVGSAETAFLTPGVRPQPSVSSSAAEEHADPADDDEPTTFLSPGDDEPTAFLTVGDEPTISVPGSEEPTTSVITRGTGVDEEPTVISAPEPDVTVMIDEDRGPGEPAAAGRDDPTVPDLREPGISGVDDDESTLAGSRRGSEDDEPTVEGPRPKAG
nr:hypothetical protein [Actinoplanes philippinensis]